MREFQQRRRVKKLLHSRYVIAGLFIVCLLLAHAVWGIYGKYRKSREIADRTQASLSALQSRQASLTEQIDSLSTAEGKEREVRDRFGVVKPGEQVVVLVDDEATDSQAAAGQDGWWSRFLSLFGF